MPFLRSRNPVRHAQQLIASGKLRCSELGSSVRAITEDCLWQQQHSGDGKPFRSFAEFVTSPQPHGLGVVTQDDMDTFGVALHKSKLYGAWREMLDATTRKRGRPKEKLVGSENKVPTFKLPTSLTARARQVMVLARHHSAIFAELEAGQLTLNEAARKAGLSKRPPRKHLRYGVLDVEGVRELRASAQGKLLCDVFKAAGTDAQCQLLANVIAPIIGPGLAQRWRDQAAQSGRTSHGRQG